MMHGDGVARDVNAAVAPEVDGDQERESELHRPTVVPADLKGKPL
jgi:hypothetical protein